MQETIKNIIKDLTRNESKVGVATAVPIVLFAILMLNSKGWISPSNWRLFLSAELICISLSIIMLVVCIKTYYSYYSLYKKLRQITIAIGFVFLFGIFGLMFARSGLDLVQGVQHYSGECELTIYESTKKSTSYNVLLKDKNHTRIGVTQELYYSLADKNDETKCKGKFNFDYLRHNGFLLNIN